jgi:PPK2 family polyphosphate:nucleotide phosphotransferase
VKSWVAAAGNARRPQRTPELGGPNRREEQTMDYRKEFRVDPGSKAKLSKLDPAYKGKHELPDEAKQEIDSYLKKLFQQQALLYAEHKHSILVVLQALDAGGKDGTIKHVFVALNPQGATVASFKQPTATELAHDFLWRVHPHAPGKGEIVIFNRSHYEDVLVTRVHKLIDKDTWTERYERIRDFEALLAENGTTIIKFFLHISKEEQLARFEQRLDDPNRNWKISESDYSERALWDDYIAAFDDAISATSTKHAPWYVIPSNHKWFRNLAVSQIMADTMEDLKLSFPPPSVNLAEIRRKYHAAVKEEKGSNKKKG